MYIATYIIDIMALVCLIGLVHSNIVLNNDITGMSAHIGYNYYAYLLGAIPFITTSDHSFI